MNKKEKIGRALHQYIVDKQLCGASYAFFSADEAEMHYDGVMGCIVPYASNPLCAGMLYDLASVSKVVGTTSRILQLIDEGRLSLETKVQTILPKFRYDQVTIEDLLLHRSGLPAEVVEKATLNEQNIRERVYQTDIDPKLFHHPQYSDVGFILLGFIIEQLDGDLFQSIETHVLKPLGMKHATYQPKSDDRCVPTEITLKRGCICGEAHDSKTHLLKQSGSAGLFASLEDLVIFAQAILKHDERLFSKEIYAQLQEVNVDGRGLGWEKPYGSAILYHTGFSGTSILIDLKHKEGMILLTNRIHPNRYASDFLKFRKALNKIYVEDIQ